jgi:hypothetical protein
MNAMGFTTTRKLCQLVALVWVCLPPSFLWSILLSELALPQLCSHRLIHHVLVRSPLLTNVLVLYM